MDAVLAELITIVGERHCLTSTDAQAPFLKDWRGLYLGRARAVVRPNSTEQVQAILRLCHQHRVPVVPQGGNTGLSGGATPDASGAAIVLSLTRLNQIHDLDPLNNSVVVEAGCVLASIQQAARDADRLFPLSLSAEGTCQIGGNLATNAGGINVLRYGNARELCLGLEVVLPDGTLLSSLHTLRKDNSGYDLKQMFIGSEGTLGVITAAALKLFPKPIAHATAMVALSTLDASVPLLARCRAGLADQMVSFELFPKFGVEIAQRYAADNVWPLSTVADWSVLIEIATSTTAFDIRAAMEQTLEAALEAGEVTDAAIASSEAQSQAMWRIREGIVHGQHLFGGSIKHDISVPVAQVPAFMKVACQAVLAYMPTARLVPFGHLGDGNIHFNLAQPEGADKDAFQAHLPEVNRIVHDVVQRFGGSITAEHGIGQLRRNELQYRKSPAELDLMRKIKAMLDPDNLMNPGKLL